MSPKLKRIIFHFLIVTFLAMFIWSGFSLCSYFREYKELKESYGNAQELVQIETIPTPTQSQERPTKPVIRDEIEQTEPIDEYKDLKIAMGADWDSLLSKSNDVVGWIYIPNTTVNYPLVHRDNLYYLDHDYLGNENNGGSIFVDARLDMDAQNVIIYGHNMRTNTMFHDLRNFVKQEYVNERRYIYIATKDKTMIYEVFAAGYTEGGSETYTWDFSDDTAISFDEYVNMAMEKSSVKMGVSDITGDDKIITLSTCSSRSDTERIVVQAVLRTEY